MKWKILSAVVALHLVVGGGLLLGGGCKNATPASPKNGSSPATPAVSPAAPAVVAETPAAVAPTVVETAPALQPGDNNSINNNGLGNAINGNPVAGATTSYTVAKGDSLSRIAKKHGTSVKALQDANNLTSAELKPGQTLVIPAAGLSSSGVIASPDVKAPLGESTDYTVVKGDSLDRVAKKFGVSVNELKAANNLKGDTIRLGQTLKVPGKHDVKSLSTPPPSKKPAATATSVEGGSTYTVKAGDLPETIAKRHGMTTRELLALNGNLDPKKLQVGQKLQVKGSPAGGASSSAAPATPAKPVAPGSATPVPAAPAKPSVSSGELPLISFGPPGSAPAKPAPAPAAPATPVPASPAGGNEALPITPVTN